MSPKLAKFSKKRTDAFLLVEQVRKKLNPRTFGSYLKKIRDTFSSEIINKVITELNLVKTIKTKNITKQQIRLLLPKNLYQYTISGNYQNRYRLKDETYRFTKRQPSSLTFFSRTKLKLVPFMFINFAQSLDTLAEQGLEIDLPLGTPNSFSKPDVIMRMPKTGSEYVLRITNLSGGKIVVETDADLKKIPLFKVNLQLSYKGFNEFNDSGVGLCVPETLLHHLKKKGRNIKLTLKKIIDQLEENYDPEYSSSIRGTCPIRGYTPLDIIRVLESYKCKGRLLDINNQEFLTTKYDKIDKNLDVFCGICFDSHLYYCSDREFLKSLSTKIAFEQHGRTFDFNTYKRQQYKKQIKKTKIENFEVCEKDDLIEEYRTTVLSGVLPIVLAKDGNIIRMKTQEKTWYANPEKTIMEEILGEDFDGTCSTTTLGKTEFETYSRESIESKFTKETFDMINKHGNAVKNVNPPQDSIQVQFDINKCRTDCLMNNKLGDYELFNVNNDFRRYSGVRRKGYYYIETDDTELFMRGNGTYSNDFLLFADSKGVRYTILYELNCDKTLPHDYFKKFVEDIITKYPDPRHYKPIINKFIGQLGRTVDKSRTGFIEPNFDLAVKYFWENNKDGIGFLDTNDSVENALWKKMKGTLCTIEKIDISEDTVHYLLQKTTHKIRHNNSMTIYNKVLENEYIRLYNLIKRVGGNLIQIKTDAIIVDGNYNKIECDTLIGGVKTENVFVNFWEASKVSKIKQSREISNFFWNTTTEKIGEELGIPSGSYCIIGPPGTGKTTLVKSTAEYSSETTLRLGFTNVSTENLAGDGIDCYTLNSYFGINFIDGKFAEAKLKNLKGVKCIILTEVFSIPSYVMYVLYKIKIAFSNIKFIGEGDPSQNRPVKEEHINWLKCELFYKLFDGNLVKLTVNKRNNEFENYDKIRNGERLAEDKYISREPQRINITKTNRKRVEINSRCMDSLGGHLLTVPDKCLNDKAQDIRLRLNTPIMCIKNNKKLKLKNGKIYAIDSIGSSNGAESSIVVNEIEFTIENFFETFVVCHAMTNHKVQGITIREPYNIYEWDEMPWYQRYTAYSRTSDGNFVKLL